MGHVTLARNLSRPLINQLGIDEKQQCLEGHEITVSEEAEKELIKQSLVLSDEDIAHQKAVQGVAKAAAITAPAKPETFSDNPHDPSKKGK